MALKLCRECEQEISKSANACPKCGCQNPHAFDITPTLLLVVFVITFVIGMAVFTSL